MTPRNFCAAKKRVRASEDAHRLAIGALSNICAKCSGGASRQIAGLRNECDSKALGRLRDLRCGEKKMGVPQQCLHGEQRLTRC